MRKETERLRHWIVRRIAPRIWQHAKRTNPLSAIPRPMTMFSKRYFNGRSIVCAEIGVADAKNSLSILRELNVETLLCIDPYLPYVDESTIYSLAVDRHNIREFLIAKENLSKFGEKVCFLRKRSEEIASEIPLSSLDFLYIDGNHSYEHVVSDIENYFPKIKEGGIIGGHDFYGRFTGVILAVIEFCKREKIDLFSELADWWIIK